MPHYEREKIRAEAEDLALGFRIDAVETQIRERLENEPPNPFDNPEIWHRLSPQSFQTPYDELARIVSEADPHSTIERWADLGAAYGRLGIVLAKTRPHARFIGIEVVAERVREGQRIYSQLGLPTDSLICGDLSSLALPVADLYFIYDFGRRSEIAHILEKIRLEARARPICVVGRGRCVRNTIEREHPWLGAVIAPLHADHYSIYRSA